LDILILCKRIKAFCLNLKVTTI